MSIPVTVNISSSDDEEDGGGYSRHSPLRPPTRVPPLPRRHVEEVLVLDDGATPDRSSMPIQKRATQSDTTPLFVPDTPQFVSTDYPSIVRCTFSNPKSSTSPERPSCHSLNDFSSGLICLDSDDDDLSMQPGTSIEMNRPTANLMDEDHGGSPSFASEELDGDKQLPMYLETQVQSDCHYGNPMSDDLGDLPKRKKGGRTTSNCVTETKKDEETSKRKKTNEEKLEERKRKRQEEKLQKEALKTEAAQMKKLKKEKEKWEKGKFALTSIIAEIDVKVIENGVVGGRLLSRFSEKGITFRVTKNPIEKSILWKMIIPDQISELSSINSEVPYVAFVYEADEFCDLLLKNSFLDHIHKVQRCHRSFTVCYITNKLMSYINKREQNQYKNPSDLNGWKRPPIEEVLSKLTINFNRVHSRQCMDEADVAEHIVGLTSSLATCRFRKKSTWLSVNAKEPLVPKGIDKILIKRSVWLKALIAIPKVQPRFALAISKKYPTVRSLLNVYLDPTKSVHDKEFFLKDLIIEGELGKESRRLGEACSKRIYRILMAQNGNSKTDDVEDGSDFFAS